MTEPGGIVETADKLRDRAIASAIGKRHSSFALYAFLADCMALAERCREQAAYDELRQAVAERECAGTREFVQFKSDEYLLVCRHVFVSKGETNRNNASRYAIAMREAAKRQINSAGLEEWLRKNGGINALVLDRTDTTRSLSMKTLYLSASITVPRNEWFTLSLRRRPNGIFEVKEHAP
jgi:hypothetical protein